MKLAAKLVVTVSSQRPLGIAAHQWGWRHVGRMAYAVKNLDLVIEPGERILLLGASGAGKSTLLHGLAGILGKDGDGDSQGSLLIDGKPATEPAAPVGLVMQDPDSQVVLARVGDEVAFGLENLAVPREEIWGRVNESLAAVGLGVPLGQSTDQLSGGQRQRLALAGVIAMRPGLLLLDEPTANLDPTGVIEVRDAVAQLAADRQITVVVVEHRVEVWADFVDRVIVLGSDGVIADGKPHDIFSQQAATLAAAGVWVPGLTAPEALTSLASSNSTILAASQLSIGYQRNCPIRTMDVAIPRGVSTCLIGPNGAGKSTLALTLAGLLPEVSGQVQAAAGLVPPRRSSRPITWRSKELLTRIGTVFQDPEHQFVSASVHKELAVGLHALRWNTAACDAKVSELLERLRLSHLANAHPFTLSGGEKRRLSVATVLATGPEVIFLDEPTFGQDRVTWIEIVSLVKELRMQGHTVVSVTHDQDYVAALGENIIDLAELS
ncbi:MAG: ABC transporter ATP-binding protein [Propionibacteriaceae bacterium]